MLKEMEMISREKGPGRFPLETIPSSFVLPGDDFRIKMYREVCEWAFRNDSRDSTGAEMRNSRSVYCVGMWFLFRSYCSHVSLRGVFEKKTAIEMIMSCNYSQATTYLILKNGKKLGLCTFEKSRIDNKNLIRLAGLQDVCVKLDLEYLDAGPTLCPLDVYKKENMSEIFYAVCVIQNVPLNKTKPRKREVIEEKTLISRQLQKDYENKAKEVLGIRSKAWYVPNPILGYAFQTGNGVTCVNSKLTMVRMHQRDQRISKFLKDRKKSQLLDEPTTAGGTSTEISSPEEKLAVKAQKGVGNIFRDEEEYRRTSKRRRGTVMTDEERDHSMIISKYSHRINQDISLGLYDYVDRKKGMEGLNLSHGMRHWIIFQRGSRR